MTHLRLVPPACEYASYSERAYFTRDAAAHCAAYEEHQRLEWLRKRSARMIGAR